MDAMKCPDVEAVEPPRLYAEIARPLEEALPLYRSEPAGGAL
jgi:hypothetical protein